MSSFTKPSLDHSSYSTSSSITDLPSPSYHRHGDHKRVVVTTALPSKTPIPPQRFEVAIARKFKAHNSLYLQQFFMKMDTDKDGHITRADIYRAFHNLLGIDLTEKQLDTMLTRMMSISAAITTSNNRGGEDEEDANSTSSLYYNTAHSETSTISSVSSAPSVLAGPALVLAGANQNNDRGKIRYTVFKKYILDTAESLSFSSSESEYGAISDLSPVVTSSKRHNAVQNTKTKQLSIVPPPNAVTYELRSTLRRLLQQHFKSSGLGGGMADTSLFLSMDKDHSGHITPDEFQRLVSSWGLELSPGQVKTILGNHYRGESNGIHLKEFIYLIEEMDDGHGLHQEMPWDHDDVDSLQTRSIALGRTEREYALRQEEKERTQKYNQTNHVLAKMLGEQIERKYQKVLNAFTFYNDNNLHQGTIKGKLSVYELHEMMNDLGIEVSTDRVLLLVKAFDSDADDFLGKSDFIKLIAYGFGEIDKQREMNDNESKGEYEKQITVTEDMPPKSEDRTKEKGEGHEKDFRQLVLSSSPLPLPVTKITLSLEESNQLASPKVTSIGGTTVSVRTVELKEKEKEQSTDILPPPPVDASSSSQSTPLHQQSSTSLTTPLTDSAKDTDSTEKKVDELILKFRTALENRGMTPRKAFEMMDVNRSKFLTFDELKRGYKRMGVETSDELIHQSIRRFDPENTGKMKFHQLIKFLSSSLEG